ncbi:hypothetical protein [Tautonia plasticadhaerens]|uniref:Uncharacterized protein n=1 Tax=Tautonia plasticadhaerens TaxID=2527974 RepID=A0A518GXJ9_9BACT|nr:hypothetical protein [Tautonia plasticadhaerens]QDV33282.1 hypothetical protein ElP_11250 [Tautonia plasticadhaerens]
MFATRRSRPRRFVPVVDCLASRIAPVGTVPPLQIPPVEAPPADTIPADQQLIDALLTFDEVCATGPMDI